MVFPTPAFPTAAVITTAVEPRSRAEHPRVQPLQSQFAPGEVRDIRRQLARHSPLRGPRRTGVLIGATGRTSGSVVERLAIGVIQTQRISKQSDCCAAWMLNLAAFEISDCPHTHARSTRELVL